MGPWLFLRSAQAQEKRLLALKWGNYGKGEEKPHNCVYFLGTLRSFECRGLGEFDTASQYYFRGVFSALDMVWNTCIEAQNDTDYELQSAAKWSICCCEVHDAST